MASHAALHTAAAPAAVSHLTARRHYPRRCNDNTRVSILPRRRHPHPLVSSTSTAPIITASAAPAAADPRDALERCLRAADAIGAGSNTCAPSPSTPVMKTEYGSAGAVTLEKSKLDLSSKTTKSSPQTAHSGGGGDIGKKNFHGGGDGGDDGGDDDDYFGDFDEGDEGDDGGLFRRRILFEEIFDRKFVDAVLQEWGKTMVNLPAGLRQAYEMSLVSSAQMVRFLSIAARPTTTRAISRVLPNPLSRAFVGRLLADPAFLYKLLLEQATTIGCSVWWEWNSRKERIKQEWDLALINIMIASACNAIVVWSLAPCRSYGNTFRFDLQNTLQKLPNNVFEQSYPMREFDMHKRVQCFFYKAAELCLVGLAAGTAQGVLSKVSSSKKTDRLSVSIPTVSTSALGYGAFLGLYANLRYQLLCGVDRAMFNHFDVLGVAMFFSTALRAMNVQIGEVSRRAWLGIEVDPLLQSENLLKAYKRPNAADQQTSNWFISKNAIVSGLGLLGIKQASGDPGPGDSEQSMPKAKRKRVVRKKVAAGST